MSDFITDYPYMVIFTTFLLGVFVGRMIERDSSKSEDCSRAEDDVGY